MSIYKSSPEHATNFGSGLVTASRRDSSGRKVSADSAITMLSDLSRKISFGRLCESRQRRNVEMGFVELQHIADD